MFSYTQGDACLQHQVRGALRKATVDVTQSMWYMSLLAVHVVYVFTSTAVAVHAVAGHVVYVCTTYVCTSTAVAGHVVYVCTTYVFTTVAVHVVCVCTRPLLPLY